MEDPGEAGTLSPDPAEAAIHLSQSEALRQLPCKRMRLLHHSACRHQPCRPWADTAPSRGAGHCTLRGRVSSSTHAARSTWECRRNVGGGAGPSGSPSRGLRSGLQLQRGKQRPVLECVLGCLTAPLQDSALTSAGPPTEQGPRPGLAAQVLKPRSASRGTGEVVPLARPQ